MKKSRKILLGILSTLFCAFAAFGLAGCDSSSGKGGSGNTGDGGGEPVHEHTWDDGVAAGVTCTTDGTTLYTCMSCGELKSVPTAKTGHNFTETYSKDSEGHWFECVNHGCDERSEVLEHKYAEALSFDAENHWHECVCGAKAETAEHVYTAGVYEKDESGHWQSCECGNETEKTGHSYPASWVKDEEYHWHTCTCGNEEKHAHTFENDICTEQACAYELIYSKGLKYTLLDDGTYAVTGVGTWEVSEMLIIPANYEGKPVTKVGERAFSFRSIKSIVFGKNVTEIGNSAFEYCVVNSIAFNEKLEIIGDFAFLLSPTSTTALTALNFPSSLKSIGKSAFSYCTALKTLILPEGLEKIGKKAFEGCTALTKVSLPNGIKEIYRDSFKGCSDSIYTIQNGYYLGNADNPYVALVIGSRLHEVVPHEQTSIIANGAFYLSNYPYSEVISVTLSDNVRYIGSDAFYNCENLTTVTFGKNVETIGYRAFGWCALTEVNIPAKVTRIEEDTFAECAITEVTIPSTLRYLGDYAFGKSASLTKVTFEEGLEEMGDAFFNCDALTGATLPKSLKKANYLFSACDNFVFNIWENGKYVGTADNPYYLFAGVIDRNVSSFVLHDDTRIVGGTFYNTKISSLTMGKNVIYIGDGVFYGNISLSDIYYKGTQEEFEKIVVSDKYNPSFYTATVHYNSTGTV